MGIIESRLFTLMLSSINKDDKDFGEVFIPVSHIISYNPSKAAYSMINEACEKLFDMKLNLKDIENPDVMMDNLHVFRRMKLVKGKGVYGWFDAEIKPYLLELQGNFTLGEIEELLSLKSAHAHKMYWFLHSLKSLNELNKKLTKPIAVDELRELLLNDTSKYKKYGEFKKFILTPAYEELSRTELKFEFEELKTGKAITAIQFIFPYSENKKNGKQISDKQPLPLPSQSNLFSQPAAELTGIELNAWNQMIKYGLESRQAEYFLSKLKGEEITKTIHKEYILKKDKVSNSAAHIYEELKKLIGRK
ncbi:replication initiation protein [Pontibacter sp. XAAS-A31]|nr:replication initiation protein [Pontibacter harenae]